MLSPHDESCVLLAINIRSIAGCESVVQHVSDLHIPSTGNRSSPGLSHGGHDLSLPLSGPIVGNLRINAKKDLINGLSIG